MDWMLVIYDSVALGGIQLAAVQASRRVSDGQCEPGRWWWRIRPRERDGQFYQDAFRIRTWKHRLPDGGGLLRDGFPKSRLMSRDRRYLERFARETCRGELAHWLSLLCAPAFLLFNPPVAGAAIQAYALAVNLPCIAVQRFNRARLLRVAGDFLSRPKAIDISPNTD